MIYIRQTDQSLEQGPVTIRGYRSLTRSHADTVIQVVESSPAECSVELHDDYEGYLSIMVSPTEENALTFLICGTVERIELCELRSDDALLSHGGFGTIEAATAELAKLLIADRR